MIRRLDIQLYNPAFLGLGVVRARLSDIGHDT